MIEARWPPTSRTTCGVQSARQPPEGTYPGQTLPVPHDRISHAAFMPLIECGLLLLAEPSYGLKRGASHDMRDNGLLERSTLHRVPSAPAAGE